LGLVAALIQVGLEFWRRRPSRGGGCLVLFAGGGRAGMRRLTRLTTHLTLGWVLMLLVPLLVVAPSLHQEGRPWARVALAVACGAALAVGGGQVGGLMIALSVSRAERQARSRRAGGAPCASAERLLKDTSAGRFH